MYVKEGILKSGKKRCTVMEKETKFLLINKMFVVVIVARHLEMQHSFGHDPSNLEII